MRQSIHEDSGVAADHEPVVRRPRLSASATFVDEREGSRATSGARTESAGHVGTPAAGPGGHELIAMLARADSGTRGRVGLSLQAGCGNAQLQRWIRSGESALLCRCPGKAPGEEECDECRRKRLVQRAVADGVGASPVALLCRCPGKSPGEEECEECRKKRLVQRAAAGDVGMQADAALLGEILVRDRRSGEREDEDERPRRLSRAGALPSALLQRAACIVDPAVCGVPIAGSAGEFGTSEATVEIGPRDRRARMSATRQRSTGHVGHARQLERFLNAQAPGLLSNIHGIFIDMDLSPGTGALTMACDQMVPPITGATKPCVFVHGDFNQQASRFNRTRAATIGGRGREDWRVSSLQTLTHEVQHVLFDTAAHPARAGCPRNLVEHELSELNAIMSEFPAAFRAIPAGAPAGDPARVRLSNWFTHAIENASESIRGILTTMRCQCDCADVDAYVRETFNFVAVSWSAAERTAFNTELRDPARGLNWPL